MIRYKQLVPSAKEIDYGHFGFVDIDMLQTALLIAISFSGTAICNLLPLRIEPDISIQPSASRLQSVYGQVTNTGVAVASINNHDGIVVQDNDRHRLVPEPSKAMAITPFLADARRPQETGGKISKSSIAVTSIDNQDGVLVDYYTQYEGNGSTKAGWPKKTSWISFQDLFESNRYILSRSCKIYHQAPNSDDETSQVYDAIQTVAKRTLVDHRFILAIIMQESGGCVRAPTSNYGVPNPGLMQDHNGTATCNDGVDADSVRDPCPADMILSMVEDGVGGTEWGDGLAQCINKAEGVDVSAFYRAARIYNSGSLHESGDLGKGGATHCYASDVANRLMGWVKFEHRCDLDL